MILLSKYFNEQPELIASTAKALLKNPAVRQASVWGLGSALGTKLSSKKKKEMTTDEKKQLKRAIVGTGIAGALAGGAGSLV